MSEAAPTPIAGHDGRGAVEDGSATGGRRNRRRRIRGADAFIALEGSDGSDSSDGSDGSDNLDSEAAATPIARHDGHGAVGDGSENGGLLYRRRSRIREADALIALHSSDDSDSSDSFDLYSKAPATPIARRGAVGDGSATGDRFYRRRSTILGADALDSSDGSDSSDRSDDGSDSCDDGADGCEGTHGTHGLGGLGGLGGGGRGGRGNNCHCGGNGSR